MTPADNNRDVLLDSLQRERDQAVRSLDHWAARAGTAEANAKHAHDELAVTRVALEHLTADHDSTMHEIRQWASAVATYLTMQAAGSGDEVENRENAEEALAVLYTKTFPLDQRPLRGQHKPPVDDELWAESLDIPVHRARQIRAAHRTPRPDDDVREAS